MESSLELLLHRKSVSQSLIQVYNTVYCQIPDLLIQNNGTKNLLSSVSENWRQWVYGYGIVTCFPVSKNVL